MSTQQRILRFRLKTDETPVSVPAGRVLLVTQERQDIFATLGHLEVWIQAETVQGWPNHDPMGSNGSVGSQEMQVFGTGQVVPDDAEHVGSVLDGPFVWHLYRLQKTGE